MERTEIFNEYARILNETGDLLDGGYRRDHEDTVVIPPPARNASGSGVPDRGLQQEGSGPEGPPRTPEYGPSNPVEPVVRPRSEESGTLKQIADEVEECRNCNLYLTREHTVPGVGGIGVTLMIVTPPPADSAGFRDSPLAVYEQEYLNKWLSALDLDPVTDIFITPAVKCRTPAGRPPHGQEVQACSGYLRRQYKNVAPRAVLALGEAACGALTGSPSDFPSLVGQDWNWGAVPALVLWTPAEVLANPGRLRGPVWEALQRLRTAWNAIPGNSL